MHNKCVNVCSNIDESERLHKYFGLKQSMFLRPTGACDSMLFGYFLGFSLILYNKHCK